MIGYGSYLLYSILVKLCAVGAVEITVLIILNLRHSTITRFPEPIFWNKEHF